MNDTKKRRGRPVGTDLKTDKIALECVADRLVANPGLKPMTAMKAVYDTGAFTGAGYQQRETTVTRWQVKWKKFGELALADARRRAEPKTPQRLSASDFDHLRNVVSAYRPPASLVRALDQNAKFMERFQKDFGPQLERFRQMQKVAETVDRIAPLLAAGRSLKMLQAIPQVPAPPTSRQLETLKRALELPALKAMNAFLNKKD